MMHDILLRCFSALLSTSAQAVVVAMAVGAVHLVLGARLPRRWRTVLWMLVIVRLVVPVGPSSRFSLFNLVHRSSPAMNAIDPNPQTVVTFGVVNDLGPTPHTAGLTPQPSQAINPVHKLDWRDIAAIVWAIGFAWLISQTLFQQIRFARQVRLSKPSDNDRLNRILVCAQQKLGVRACRVVENDLVSSPALFGPIHPTLIVPTSFADRFSNSEIQSVFEHELAHARRRDLLIDWLLAWVVFIHWFNPTAWLTWRRLRAERELACDEVVLRGRSEIDRVQYGQTILRILEELTSPRHIVGTAGIIERGGSLRRRLTAIASPCRPSRWFSALGLACVAVIGCATLTSPNHSSATSPAATTAADGNGLVTYAYDGADLLTPIPDFNDAPDFNHPTTAAPATNHAPQRTRDELIAEIQSKVDPASWQIRGGPGSIREDSGKLVVIQSAKNQEAVWNLLQGIRSRRAVQVTLETRFLREPPGVMDDWAKMNVGHWIKQDQFDMWSAAIENPQADELIRDTQRGQSGSVITAPRLTLFDGQRAYVIVSTSRAYVKDIHEIKSATQPSLVGYDPQIDTVQSGVLLDSRVKVSDDHQSVIVDLRPKLSNLISMETSPWHDSSGEKKADIQIPHVKELSVETTQTIPNERTLLMRLHEVEHPAPTTHPAVDELVYLMVRPKVMIQADTKGASPLKPTRIAPLP